MKIVLKVVLVAALSMFVTNVFAQKFGHINQREVMNAMPEVKAAQTTLEAYGKELEGQLEELQVEINKKIEEYSRIEATLSEEMKNSKIKEIQDMNTRLRERQQIADSDFQKKQEELYTPIFKKANEAIEKVAKENNCIYVFDPSTLLYIDTAQSIDLAPGVKRALGI